MADSAGTDSPVLIAVDWGTSAQRAWLLGEAGQVLDSRRSDQGLLEITGSAGTDDAEVLRDAYEEAFWTTCGEWLTADPSLPTVVCGMAGSRQGWREAGYLSVPSALELSLEDLSPVEHRVGTAHLVPGIRIATSASEPGDVMRGEETQVVGIVDSLSAEVEALTIVLPGTHSKWVSLSNGLLTTFTTSMSGELYGLVLEHGLLGRTAAPAAADEDAFRRGAAAASSPSSRGIQSELFGARVLVLEGLLHPSSVPDYVSGVLLADEVSHLLPATAAEGEIVLCGADELCRRYASVLSAAGVEAQVMAEDMTARGLWTIALSTGLTAGTNVRGRPPR